jgi:hypothetical protein
MIHIHPSISENALTRELGLMVPVVGGGGGAREAPASGLGFAIPAIGVLEGREIDFSGRI